MNRRMGWVGGLLAAMLSLGGCSSVASPDAVDGGMGGAPGAGGATGTGGTGGYAGRMKAIVDAYCATARSCCGKAGYAASGLDDCETIVPAQVYSVGLADRGAVDVDPTAFAACLAAYQRAASTCTITDVFAACRPVLSGTKGPGQPCGAALECRQDQGPMICLIYQPDGVTSDLGTCAPVPHAKPGAECSGSCDAAHGCLLATVVSGPPAAPTDVPPSCFAQDGLRCDYTQSTETCVPLIPDGQSCGDNPYLANPCAADSYCDGTCKKLLAVGQPCPLTIECAQDLACNGGKCAPAPFADPYVCTNLMPTP